MMYLDGEDTSCWPGDRLNSSYDTDVLTYLRMQYQAGRKASHWPYKMFRCKREGDGPEWTDDNGRNHTDPGGMRAALLQFLEDIATQ